MKKTKSTRKPRETVRLLREMLKYLPENAPEIETVNRGRENVVRSPQSKRIHLKIRLRDPETGIGPSVVTRSRTCAGRSVEARGMTGEEKRSEITLENKTPVITGRKESEVSVSQIKKGIKKRKILESREGLGT